MTMKFARLGGLAALSLYLGACTGQVSDGRGTIDVPDPSNPKPSADGPVQLNLKGTPAYYRFVRLTNDQWANSVKDLLGGADASDLTSSFQQAVPGTTDFVNNELLLDVDSRSWSDFQGAAEAMTAKVTASDSTLAKVYTGTDASGFITTVGRRAYRRPLTAAETSAYMTLFSKGSTLTGSRSAFAKGASLVLRAMLQSPYFLYRNELTAPGKPLSSYEIAAKLSLWLRNTTPNAALLDAAAGSGKLDTADGVVAMAKTMLEESTATAVMRTFHGQYLHLDRLQTITKVMTPSFDMAINDELQESSFLFFDKIFLKGLGLKDALTSTSGFVGPKMAKLYGGSVAAPASGFAERDLGAQRVGYFTQLPYLILNSHEADPDAIHRGANMNKDVLCSLLGPPMNQIPGLQQRVKGETSREVVDKTTAGCGQACHNEMINPIGFAFQKFDGLGQYRETESFMGDNLTIDSSGSFAFIDGRKNYQDAAELMHLMADGSQAHLCYAKKLASFGLQRDIVADDMPLLTALSSTSRSGSVKQMVLDLVRNDAFRVRQGGAQ